jgi:flagellar motor switch protein FliG
VINADDRYLQEFLHKMSDKDIAILISDKNLEFRGKILSNVSSGRGMNIVDEENLIKPLRKADVDAATKDFYAKLRHAFEKGDLYIKGRSEEDVYVE